MPVEFATPELQTNEAFKNFQSADDLGKAYLELNSKVSTGDISVVNEELRKDPSLTFKNVNDLAKSYIETKKLVGGIKKAPEKAEDYKFTQLQNLHPGMKNIPETQKILAGIFHEAGLHNEAADIVQSKVLTLLSGSLTKQEEMRKAKNQEVETALRADWKENYDKNKDTIEKILTRAGAGDLAKSIGSDPVTLKAMHKITALLSEDSVGKLGDSGDAIITDKKSAQDQIQNMIKSQWHLLKGADYEKAEKEWTRLHSVAYSQ